MTYRRRLFNDIILIVAILIVTGVFMIYINMNSSKTADYVEIYVNNEIYKIESLEVNKKVIIRTKQGENILSIHDRGVEMIQSSCPDHVCEKTGFISKDGEIIVCLPNKILVEIKSSKEGDIDAISE